MTTADRGGGRTTARQGGPSEVSEEPFGVVLRRFRDAANLTQEELAGRSGLSVHAISMLERGVRRTPRPSTVEVLATALGLDPSQRAVLIAYRAVRPAAGLPVTTRPVPAQLPADVSGFTGRRAELDALDALLCGRAASAWVRPGRRGHRAGTGRAADAEGAPVVISAVSGTAGVGKTALAIRWAHRVRSRFPDGQLYINLRGYDPEQPMGAAAALAVFLGALGVAGHDIPLDLDERVARYRTECAGRRILVVLDNASTVEQVRPLLPGTGSCAVLVTSRDSLAGLIAVNGARRLDLDLLSPAEAVELLRALVGSRVDAEPDAAAALATQCARLPLALRVAAELALARPATPLADVVAELTDQQHRLESLDAGGDPRAAVRTVFSWSYRHLPKPAARTFRMLGLHPGADFDAYAAAALAGTSVRQARLTLDLLARAHLVHPTAGGRHGMHDLLRAYAVGLATAKDAEALGRVFDYYLAAAAAAMDTLHPAEAHRRPSIPSAATAVPVLTEPATAREWLDTHRPALVAVAGNATAHGRPEHAVRLASILFRYLGSGHYVDALAMHTSARQAAQKVGDLAGEALALHALGTVYSRIGPHGQAMEYLQQALVLFRRVGDPVGQARVLSNISSVETRLGRYGPAADTFEEALALYRQAGDRLGEARALTNLGLSEQRLGRHEQAGRHLELALAIHRQVGDHDGEAWALNILGHLEQHLGRYDEALDHHQQALTISRRLGNTDSEGLVLDSLGGLSTRRGEPERAIEYHQRALALFRQAGNQLAEGWSLIGLGEAAVAAGNFSDALVHHTAALHIAADVGANDQEARAHAGLGRALHARGELTGARGHYRRALVLFAELGMPDGDDIRARLAEVDAGPGPR